MKLKLSMIVVLLCTMLFVAQAGVKPMVPSDNCCCTQDCQTYCLMNGSCGAAGTACNGGSVGGTQLNYCCAASWGLCNLCLYSGCGF